MPIRIVAKGDLYIACLAPPEYQSWLSAGPMSATEVLETLSALGCHSTDITDALTAANPDWAAAHNAEVWRRRGLRDGGT